MRLGVASALFLAAAVAAGSLSALDEEGGFRGNRLGMSIKDMKGAKYISEGRRLKHYRSQFDQMVFGAAKLEKVTYDFRGDALVSVVLVSKDVDALLSELRNHYGAPTVSKPNGLAHEWTGQVMSLTYSADLKRATVVYAAAKPEKRRETDDSPEITYYSKPLKSPKGMLPACTPLAADVGDVVAQVTDPNGFWGKFTIGRRFWDTVPSYTGFDECVAAVPEYKDRYTPEMVVALQNGELAAGMPIEFALMILGPPTQKPAVMSVLNPITGAAENLSVYSWVQIFKKTSVLRIVFNVVNVVALGVAGTTSDLGTAVGALRVANVASAADLVTWSLSDLPQTKLVTIHVNQDRKIALFMAQ